MSLKAITWVMENAPVESPAEMVILYALADRAHDDGSTAWPSYQWIADRAVCSRRTVIRHIKAMEKRGLIKRGDQRFVQHLPSDKRPTVWDLDLSLRRQPKEPAGCQSDTPRTTGVSSRAERGDSSCNTGVSSRAERGDKGDTQSVLEPSIEPSMNQPPVVPQGGPDDGVGQEVDIVQGSQSPAAPDTSGSKSRGTRIPEKFFPTGHSIDLIRKQFPGITEAFLVGEHAKFLDHWVSVSGAKGRKIDWDATWRNWIRTAVDRLRPAERAVFTRQAPPQAPQYQTPSKADQYRDIGAQVAAEFAQGGGA